MVKNNSDDGGQAMELNGDAEIERFGFGSEQCRAWEFDPTGHGN
jgi:hypothetical protein